MKHGIAMAFLGLCLSSQAGVKITAVDSRSGDEPNILYVTAESLRVDTPAQQQSIVFEADAGVLKHVDHGRQQYMVLDEASINQISGTVNAAMEQMQQALASMPAEQRAMMEGMMGKAMGSSEPAREIKTTVEKTGERETINGYPCIKYLVKAGGVLQSELWVTPFTRLKADRKELGALFKLTDFQEKLVQAFSKQPGLAQELRAGMIAYEDIDGLPILIRMFQDGELSSETRVKHVQSADVDPGLFQVPSGYKRQDIPQMPKGGF